MALPQTSRLPCFHAPVGCPRFSFDLGRAPVRAVCTVFPPTLGLSLAPLAPSLHLFFLSARTQRGRAAVSSPLGPRHILLPAGASFTAALHFCALHTPAIGGLGGTLGRPPSILLDARAPSTWGPAFRATQHQGSPPAFHVHALSGVHHPFFMVFLAAVARPRHLETSSSASSGGADPSRAPPSGGLSASSSR